jgi:hypothetical protein
MRLRLSEISISIGGEGKLQPSSAKISVSIDLFVYWLEISMVNLVKAKAAHIELLAVWGRNDYKIGNQFLEKEFAYSLQCITAAAISVDAFYAMVRDNVPVSEQEIDAWRTNRTSRPKQIAEVLRRGFLIGPNSFKTMRGNLIELFKWRDWSVHPPAGYDKPVRYDELLVGTEWRFVAFKFDNAKNALALSLSLLSQLLTRPKPSHKSLADHCQNSIPLVSPLVEQWEDMFGQLYEREPSEDKTVSVD